MKYMALITQGDWWTNASEAERQQAMPKIGEWWGRLFGNGTMLEGHQLKGPDTATTVVIERGRHTISDRPLMEAKEAIGGYGILEAPDLDAAIAIVKTMPVVDAKVELRPIIDRPR
jgi:hypothetical protein